MPRSASYYSPARLLDRVRHGPQSWHPLCNVVGEKPQERKHVCSAYGGYHKTGKDGMAERIDILEQAEVRTGEKIPQRLIRQIR